MTFYWWSHWFWITSLGIVVLHVALVHPYPSQEISLEYNHNAKPLGAVTKLHPTTATTAFTWATTAPPVNKTRAQEVPLDRPKTMQERMSPSSDATSVASGTSTAYLEDDGDDNVDDDDDDDDDDNATAAADVDVGVVGDDNPATAQDRADTSAEYEFKRSAEVSNKTDASTMNQQQQQQQQLLERIASDSEKLIANASSDTAVVQLNRDEPEVSNYTNFSSAASVNASEDTGSPTNSANVTGNVENLRENASSTLAWLNAVAAVTVSDEGEPAVADQKAPFTLENANKEEELRRAENEHRSRKSKVLTAEYKHINRFINLPADSKSLLTRAASTAPNEYDNDDGNISSEALAIQRTYFLDAGAISAICFTVFGFCCTVGTIGIVLYRRRFLNKPQALSEPDSSVYIDDSTMRVSDNSDEMYSLDNDSFLNSLEAMTIQNYWTDTVKHTKL